MAKRKGFRPKGGFVKTLKNKAYFKRFQVKYRRRREGKTDYRARRFLIVQDKTKYNAPKYRLVARITNQRVISQVVIAGIRGDEVISQACSYELPKFGIKCGLTNYAACYATGLLLARRTLQKLSPKLFEEFQGDPDVECSDEMEVEDGAFKAFLDVGLARTTTGAKVFGVMKGAADGGIMVPHSVSRFPGYDKDSEELNSETLRGYIFGKPVADYMEKLQKEDKAKYEKQFSRYIKEKVKPGDLQGIYEAAHAAIRKDPSFTKKAAKKDPKCFKPSRKRTYAERKHRANQYVAKLRADLEE